uniref:Uncharacterized protein n=1 Tax=Helianthus annuus TaxID=4232 RepID=A0A251VI54_HELAN
MNPPWLSYESPMVKQASMAFLKSLAPLNKIISPTPSTLFLLIRVLHMESVFW